MLEIYHSPQSCIVMVCIIIIVRKPPSPHNPIYPRNIYIAQNICYLYRGWVIWFHRLIGASCIFEFGCFFIREIMTIFLCPALKCQRLPRATVLSSSHRPPPPNLSPPSPLWALVVHGPCKPTKQPASCPHPQKLQRTWQKSDDMLVNFTQHWDSDSLTDSVCRLPRRTHKSHHSALSLGVNCSLSEH